ncbi:DUF4190 domain-containing protein [Microbacterium fluvii]|uniref:DUF4190 domain-containing protein n=1 Tax=Microbacterium fluvii TaxID=415215 RepID=A0ABW2HG47_9MICO|nr:DUF4190 domain-containing protein [Microbacterium fluvii]MCU4672601.1 DUF4190 domain-containing protein [Microbacterium fluvii]
MSDQNPTPPAADQPEPPAAPAGYPQTPPPAAPTYGQPTPGAAPVYGQPPAYGAAPAYGAPPAYGTGPAYGSAPAYGAYAPAKTNSLAIVSLIASIAGLTVIPLIGTIVGIITGHMSLSQLKTSGEGGRGMALAGVIIGWVSLALGVLFVILAFALFIPLAIAGSTYSA